MKLSLKILLLPLALTIAGCASDPSPNAQNVERWPSFLLDFSKPDSVPVERVSSHFGRVVTAHASAHGATLRVEGLLNKQDLAEVRPGSHVDVLLLNAKGKVIAAATSEYFPRPLDRYGRRGFRYSHYEADLPLPRQPGATVRVIFHDTPLAECQFARKQ